MRVPRVPPRGNRLPVDMIEQIYQLRGISIPPKHVHDLDWPPKGSPEEMPLEGVARSLGYKLPLPKDWKV